MAIYQWTRLTPCGSQPSPRRSCAAAIIPPDSGCDTDSASSSGLILLGGCTREDGRKQYEKSWYFAQFSTHVLWHQMGPELQNGIAVLDCAVAWSARSKQLFCFGGTRDGYFFNELHALTLDLKNHTGDIEGVCCAGRRPMPRSRTALVALDSLWLFGGCNLTSYPASIFNDLWCFDGTWRRVDAGPGPPARAGHACTAIEDGLIVAGGWTGRCMLGDLWTLTGVTDSPSWTELAVGIPKRACFGFGVLDGVAVVFGGVNHTFGMSDELEVDMVLPFDLTVVHPDIAQAQRGAAVDVPPARRAFMVSGVLGSSLVCAMGGDGSELGNTNDVYMLAPRTWSPETHKLFPPGFRKRIFLWLLLQVRLKLLPNDLWILPIHFLSAHDFAVHSFDNRSVADKMREMLANPRPSRGGRYSSGYGHSFVTVF